MADVPPSPLITSSIYIKNQQSCTHQSSIKTNWIKFRVTHITTCSNPQACPATLGVPLFLLETLFVAQHLELKGQGVFHLYRLPIFHGRLPGWALF